MKKLLVLASVAFLLSGVAIAENGKKKKSGKKSGSCCTKSGKTCKKEKEDITAEVKL